MMTTNETEIVWEPIDIFVDWTEKRLTENDDAAGRMLLRWLTRLQEAKGNTTTAA